MVSNPASLTGLPVELRELIWQAVVVDPEPLTAYISNRTFRVPECSITADPTVDYLNDKPGQLVRQIKTFPEYPELRRVSRSVRQEVLTVFFRDNIFAFCLDRKDGVNEVFEWMATRMRKSVRPSISVRYALLWTVRLEFHEVSEERGRERGAIDIKLDTPAARVALTYSMGAVEKCHCKLAELAEFYSGHWKGKAFSRLTGEVIHLLSVNRDAYAGSVEGRDDQSRHVKRCDECGLPPIFAIPTKP